MLFRLASVPSLRHVPRFFSSTSLHPYTKWANEQMHSFKGENRIRLVQTDGAGTIVDKYCLAPLNAFRSVFEKRGFELTHTQITGPMGIKKIKHIEHFLYKELNNQWQQRYGTQPNDIDVALLHDEFTKKLNAIIKNFSDPTPYVDEAFQFFKQHALLCGLTTGYSRKTADLGMSNLYSQFDATTTANEVKQGTRIAMIQKNMDKLKESLKLPKLEMESVIFFTDASSDLSDILSATDRPWGIAVADYSTHVGISSENELDNIDSIDLSEKRKEARRLLSIPKPHAVINNMAEAALAIVAVNAALARGETPTQTTSLDIKYPENTKTSPHEPSIKPFIRS